MKDDPQFPKLKRLNQRVFTVHICYTNGLTQKTTLAILRNLDQSHETNLAGVSQKDGHQEKAEDFSVSQLGWVKTDGCDGFRPALVYVQDEAVWCCSSGKVCWAFCNDLVEVPRTSISNSTWNSEHGYLTGIWQLISRYIQIYSYFPNINSSEFAISIPIGCRSAISPSWFCAGHIDWRALWSRLQEGGFRLEPIWGETRRRSHWKIWENEVEDIIAKTAKTQNYVTVTQVHKKTQHSWTRTSSILLDFSLTQKKRDEKGRSLDDEMIWHFALAVSTPLVKCIWTKASLMGLCKWYTWAIMGHFERETSDAGATSINFGSIIFSDPNDRCYGHCCSDDSDLLFLVHWGWLKTTPFAMIDWLHHPQLVSIAIIIMVG